jgi:geranylgeranyl diphosphate synthase type II
MSIFTLPSFVLKKRQIDLGLKKMIHQQQESLLKEACLYSFFSGGKRVRPIIVLMIKEALNCPYDILDAALAIEIFHTSSLIADDLPCMDNDLLRRGIESTHVKFGETTALLTSYGLVSLAFEKIYDCAEGIRDFDENLDAFSKNAAMLCLKAAAGAAGFKGATLGQSFDMNPVIACEKDLDDLLYLKTVTLFEVSCLFGWIFGGGALSQVDQVKEMALHFGMAYQIGDDLQDLDEDLEKGKKSNFAILFGEERAEKRFNEHVLGFEKALKDLNLETAEFLAVVKFIKGFSKKKVSRS